MEQLWQIFIDVIFECFNKQTGYVPAVGQLVK